MGLLPRNVVTSKRVHVTRVTVCSIAFKHDVQLGVDELATIRNE
jgi:hypothetical protein